MIPPQSGLPDDNGEIAAPAPAGPSKTLKEFLENVPPGQEVVVTDGVVPVASRSSSDAYNIDSPNLELHCDNEKCGGVRTFKKVTRFDDIIGTGVIPVYVRYLCCNCSKKVKLYALLMCLGAEGWIMRKLAEVPDFGAPTPSKLITLIRDERDYYVKGRRSENQGLGIAAFAYYRRVVEKQKQRIFAEVIRAAKKTNAPQSNDLRPGSGQERNAIQ
jgi:hypothetical protein